MATPQSVLELAKTYATYFVEDFAVKVMNNLSGSHRVDADKIRSFIIEKTNNHFDSADVNLTSTNSANRFLFECAEYALNQNVEEPETYTNWKKISNLPSLHHQEIEELIFHSAELYQSTVNKTLFGVVARDAHMASESIVQAAQTRIASTETGGVLQTFGWGILNDGLWLNAALLRAHDLALIFRPGDPVVSYYANTAFDFARQHASLENMNQNQQMLAAGDLNMLLSHAENPDLPTLLNHLNESTLNDLLFASGVLVNRLNIWEQGITKTHYLVESVKELTILARLLPTLIETANLMEDQTLISDTTRNRLESAYNVVVLSLAGYEALRETKHSKTLLLDITAEGTDPKVDVVVNGDLLNGYQAAGGEDSDLVRFGTYLDPRKGLPFPSNGYSMEYVMARRDDVIPKVIAEDADRLDQLRQGDTDVIQAAVKQTVTGVVNSYREAGNFTAERIDLSQRISRLSQRVTHGTEGLMLDEEITKILVSALEDPFLSSVTDKLLFHLHQHHDHAPAYAIAETAVQDAFDVITKAQ